MIKSHVLRHLQILMEISPWLYYAGDVGHYDKDGHVIISDRIKELIKVKGNQVGDVNIYP